jgi:tetratricopeptide (TPR) repeat protein
LKAKKLADKSNQENRDNLLIKQTKNYLSEKKISKIKNLFNCKNPKDPIAEFFYIIANLYASEEDYQKSNFYLKISLYLNNSFLPNKALLAENFYYQKKNELSKEVYYSLKPLGFVYSWYAEKNISSILEKEKGKVQAVENLEKEFKKIKNKKFEHYYDMANFYKNNQYFLKSIEYYSLALENIKEEHSLVPKILYRRGTCYERIDDWKKAENDFNQSLNILPDQAHVLNYLAYTWIDKGINLDKGLEMLIKANELKQDDPYIIDSLGWAYYAKKNYKKAEFFLKKAVTLLPSEPVISDHYADALWMVNKKIQARYIWDYVYKLKESEKELKDIISKKLIFGLTKNL